MIMMQRRKVQGQNSHTLHHECSDGLNPAVNTEQQHEHGHTVRASWSICDDDSDTSGNHQRKQVSQRPEARRDVCMCVQVSLYMSNLHQIIL